jgi:cyclophilin family peptidyl-prolyl cis-trans isomerase
VRKPLSPECQREAAKNVPGEFTPVRHVKGILSMGRMADPDSGGSSFSMLLGKAPHLDMSYTVFGRVIDGLDVLGALEHVETKRQGIFVMPKERIEITRAVVVDMDARTEL